MAKKRANLAHSIFFLTRLDGRIQSTTFEARSMKPIQSTSFENDGISFAALRGKSAVTTGTGVAVFQAVGDKEWPILLQTMGIRRPSRLWHRAFAAPIRILIGESLYGR